MSSGTEPFIDIAQTTASDKDINTSFQRIVRKTRDSLCNASVTDTRSIRIKIMCAVIAYEGITVEDVRSSFRKTGLWPMDFGFAERFKTGSDVVEEQAAAALGRVNDAGPASRLASVKQRQSDQGTYKELEGILRGKAGISRKLQAVQVLLHSRDTVNTVLMSLSSRSGSGKMSASTSRSETGPDGEGNVL